MIAKWAGDKKAQLDPADLERLADAMGIALPEVSVKDFRSAGYLPEAIVNFIALLGWTPPKNEDGSERERFDGAFLAERFTVEKIGKSNARFDRKKLLNFNMDAILAMDTSAYEERFRAWAIDHAPEVTHVDASLVHAVQAQSKTMRDTADRCVFAVASPSGYDEKAGKKVLAKNEGQGVRLLASLREELEGAEAWETESLEGLVSSFAESQEVGMGQVAQPIRIAVTGAGVSPPIGVTLRVLGREETLARIDACLKAHSAMV